MKTKTFDCIEMKRRGSREVYSRIKNMTPKQELEYWRKRTVHLQRRIKAAKRKAAGPASK
jgi:hypothetical protein